MTNRTVSTRTPSSSVRRAGAVGETDSSHDLPARSRRTRRSSCSVLRRLDLAARVGHAPTRPLRAAFRYPHPGAVARPCRTSGPSLCLASSSGAPGVRSLRRFNPTSGWPRRLRPTGPTCRSRRFIRVPINFRRDDRPPIRFTNVWIQQAVDRGTIRLRLLGFDSRLRSVTPSP
jgi:hypothetical protein